MGACCQLAVVNESEERVIKCVRVCARGAREEGMEGEGGRKHGLFSWQLGPQKEGGASRDPYTSQTRHPKVRITRSRPTEPLKCLWR